MQGRSVPEIEPIRGIRLKYTKPLDYSLHSHIKFLKAYEVSKNQGPTLEFVYVSHPP